MHREWRERGSRSTILVRIHILYLEELAKNEIDFEVQILGYAERIKSPHQATRAADTIPILELGGILPWWPFAIKGSLSRIAFAVHDGL